MKRTAFVALLTLASVNAFAEEKPDGIDWIAFPIFEGNTDAGFVFGAQASIINYGPHVSPFVWELRAKASYSTKNRHDHRIVFDAPKLIRDDISFYVQAEFVHIADANWFGIATKRVSSDETYAYNLTEPGLEFSFAKHFERTFYTGIGVKSLFSIVSTQPDTLLARERPAGWNGDRNVIGLLFAGFANTDDPFSPRRGTEVEAYVKGTTKPVSRHNWGGAGFVGSGYIPVVFDDLVFAQRLMFETLGGDVPISQMTRIGGERTVRGLGGVFTQRGFVESRFAGRSKALSNTELRYYFPPLWENLVFGLAGFTDVSKILDSQLAPQPSYGGELSIAWKGAFLFRIDYGVSREGGEFYIEGKHLF